MFAVVLSVLSLALRGMFVTFYPDTYRAAMHTFGTPTHEAITALKAMPGIDLFSKISMFVALLSLLWLFFACGTFRHLASVSRLRSAIAAAIFLLLMLPLAMLLTSIDAAAQKSDGTS